MKITEEFSVQGLSNALLLNAIEVELVDCAFIM